MGSTIYRTFDVKKHGSPRLPASKVWLEGLTREQQEKAFEDLAVAYAPWMFEAWAAIDNKPVILESYQIKYLLDKSNRRIMLATRQGGKSFAVSAAKMHKALTTPGYKCDIVSINITEATDKIRYIRNFYDTLPPKLQPPLGKDNWLSIQFRTGPNASVITSKAASAGVRGGRKDVVFDEVAHIPKIEDHFTAALPATMRSQGTSESQIDMLSTPRGKTGLFYEIYDDPSGKRETWSRHKFYWFDVSHFITDPVAARRAWEDEYNEDIAAMHDMVERFGSPRLHEMVEDLPTWEEFLQEFCCQFVDESSSFFPYDLIDRCRKQKPLAAEVAKDIPPEILEKEGGFLEPWFARPDKNKNEIYMGIDWAENAKGGDQTAIQILEKLPNGRYLQRYTEVLNKPEFRNFDYQVKHVTDLIAKFKPSRVRVDETGLGRTIAQDLKKTHGSLVEPITFTNANKEAMALTVKGLMERDMLWLQAEDRLIRGQIHGIQREVLPGGSLRYEGKPHDDMFWALCLACKGSGKASFRIWSPGM